MPAPNLPLSGEIYWILVFRAKRLLARNSETTSSITGNEYLI